MDNNQTNNLDFQSLLPGIWPKSHKNMYHSFRVMMTLSLVNPELLPHRWWPRLFEYITLSRKQDFCLCSFMCLYGIFFFKLKWSMAPRLRASFGDTPLHKALYYEVTYDFFCIIVAALLHLGNRGNGTVRWTEIYMPGSGLTETSLSHSVAEHFKMTHGIPGSVAIQ